LRTEGGIGQERLESSFVIAFQEISLVAIQLVTQKIIDDILGLESTVDIIAEENQHDT